MYYYEVKNPPVAYNLTVSPQLQLEAYRWCFPIVGCLPYKGYFDKQKALDEMNKMSGKGYDTYLRPVAAYSTLGWFKDPIFSTMLRYEETTLVEIILHEMVHATIFIKDQGAFNEGVATFIGEKGTLAFYQTRKDTDEKLIDNLEKKWKERLRFRDAMQSLAKRLRALYASTREDAEKISVREEVFFEAKQSFQTSLDDPDKSRYERVLQEEWNNAFLISYLTYRQDLAFWEDILEAWDGDLKAMVLWLKGLDAEKDPLSYMHLWLDKRGNREPEN